MSQDDAPPPAIIPSELSGKDHTLASLPVQLDIDVSKYKDGHIDSIIANWRASCYLATAQVSL